MTTGLLGGSFNPPHNGHVALARAALEHFGLSRLVVVVVGDAPHKEVDLPAETRFRLAHAAFSELPRTVFSRFDMERIGPAYTVDTVRYAEKEWGDVIFLVGADEFAHFLEWHEPDEVLEHARLGVATRPGYDRARLETVLEQLRRPERVLFFDLEPQPISSSDIRQRVVERLPIDHLVPSSVDRLVEELGLYRPPGPPLHSLRPAGEPEAT